MHDRTVNGKTYVFGNQGALFINAMTWWDHETGSIWQMERGIAIEGPLEGQALRSMPYIPAFDGAWHNFYPNSERYSED